MPGGRLTLQERQRIATGLADGLAYAEIARSVRTASGTPPRPARPRPARAPGRVRRP
ncbi:helix-turn-helix domain-containing protein, partial [Streptomyces nigra]